MTVCVPEFCLSFSESLGGTRRSDPIVLPPGFPTKTIILEMEHAEGDITFRVVNFGGAVVSAIVVGNRLNVVFDPPPNTIVTGWVRVEAVDSRGVTLGGEECGTAARTFYFTAEGVVICPEVFGTNIHPQCDVSNRIVVPFASGPRNFTVRYPNQTPYTVITLKTFGSVVVAVRIRETITVHFSDKVSGPGHVLITAHEPDSRCIDFVGYLCFEMEEEVKCELECVCSDGDPCLADPCAPGCPNSTVCDKCGNPPCTNPSLNCQRT